jgi:hypothetical protein
MICACIAVDYFHVYAKTPKKDLKVKSKSGLLRFLEITKEIIADPVVSIDLRRKLTQLKDVLERWEISGLNRKLQMKPQKWDDDDVPVEDERVVLENSFAAGLAFDGDGFSTKTTSPLPLDLTTASSATGGVPVPILPIVPTRRNRSGGGGGGGTGLATEVLVILKWGGDLTPMGREQAEHLGAQFRTEHYPDHENGGVLRLHATYRHDLKIKASDEGRVMKTAAAFTKGLLELEGQLTPILASLVTIEEKNRTMLDSSENFEMKQEMERCKEHLNLLQVDEPISDALIDVVAPGCSPAIRAQFKKLENPLATLKRIYALVEQFVQQLKEMAEQEKQALAEQAAGLGGNSGGGSSSGGGVSGLVSGEVSPVHSLAHSPTTPGTAVRRATDDSDENNNALAVTTAAAVPTESADPGAFTEIPADFNAVSTEPGESTAAAAAIQPPDEEDSDGGDGEEVVLPGLYLTETYSLMHDRWNKLYKDFYNVKAKQFDLTKVPDVYDMIRYDVLHNSHLHVQGMDELFGLSSVFESCVVPQEYGIDKADKKYIAAKMCGALVEKIKHDLTVAATMDDPTAHSGTDDRMLYQLDHSHAQDLQINSLERCVRTRLYVTAESHNYS